MNRIYKYVLMVSLPLMLMLVGCRDILDITPDGRLTLEEIFSDHNKTGAFLNSCYNNIHPKGFNYEENMSLLMACSDEAFSAGGEDKRTFAMYNGSASPAHHAIRDCCGDGKDFWSLYFTQIKYCTIFIQHIDGANVSSADIKAEWKAEAYTMRAYFLHELMKWYGKLPYEPNGYPVDYDYSKARRLSTWQIAAYIESDCRAAIATTQLPWYRTQDNEKMRATKALAWAIMSKSYLFAASPLFNEGAEVREKWKKAYEVNKETVLALEAAGFELFKQTTEPTVYSGPEAAFHQLMSMDLDWPTDKETLWRGKHKQDPLRGYIGGNWTSAGSPGACPTQEMIDAFEVTNADRSKAEPLLNLDSPYADDEHINPNFNGAAIALGYSESAGANPYRNRDPRMKASVFANGDDILWNNQLYKVECYIGGQHELNERQDEHRYTRTGYYQRKFVKPGTSKDVSYSGVGFKYFRLAEIKLNYAEAAIEYGSAGAMDEAKAQIDQIRDRVDMPALPEGLDQDQLRLRLRNERRVEMAFEENRYFDVRRWQGPRGDLSATDQYMTAMRITNDGGVLKYERKLIRDRMPTSNSYKTRDLLLPLTQAEVSAMNAKTGVEWQNRGWN